MHSVSRSLLVAVAITGLTGCGGGDDGSSDAPMSADQTAVASADTPLAPGGASDAALIDPAESDPAMMDPAMTDPAMTDPAMTDPAMTDLALADTATTDTALTDPAMIDPAMIDPAGDAGAASLGADGTGYGVGGPAPMPKDLLGRAKQALREGRDYDAFQFYHAHALMNDDAAREVLDEMKWFPLRNHPALAIQWGVGINFTSAPGIQGDLFPIGSTQQFASPRRIRRTGEVGDGTETMMPHAGAEMTGMEGASGARANPAIAKMTGDFGQKVIDQFMERMKKGDFGSFLQNAEEDQPQQTGGGAEYGAMSGMEGGGGSAAADGAPAQLTPGVTLVGIDNEKNLTQKAEELGLDVLVIFHVNVARAPRTGYITNNNKLTLHDLRTGRRVYQSDALTNIAVQKARETGKSAKDPVEKEVEDLFNFVDKTYRLIPMPAGMKAEHAIAMVKELIATTPQNPLPVLVEIKYYHTLQLLTDQHLESAYARVVDPPAATILASGSEEERKKILEAWIPK